MKNFDRTLAALFLLFTIFMPSAYAETSNSATSAWIQRLQDQGWDKTAATEVVNLNQDWFASLAENYSRELDAQLELLSRLGKYPQFVLLLRKHPELAGLLAGSENPRLLVKTLSDENCYSYLTQQYSLQATPDDVLALAEALDRHGQMICTLAKRGIPGASAVFVFPHNTIAGREYARWLDEVVRNASSQSDDQLAELISFIVTEGGNIRRRMERNAAFRYQFRSLWWRLVRTVQNEKFLVAVTEPRIWDLLALPQGEGLLKDWGPEVPTALLFDDIAYPKELHETIIELMRNGDEQTMNALIRFAGEPVLNTFLRRDLNWDIKATVLKKHTESCPKDFDQPCPRFIENLNRYNQMSESALVEDLQPEPSGPKTWIPFYTSYYTVKKIAQGREFSNLDLISLGVDVSTVAIPVSEIAGNIIRGSAETIAKETIAKETVKGYTSKQIDEKISIQIVEQIAENLTEKQLVPQALILKKYMPVISKAQGAIARDPVEVTKVVQSLFEKTGVSQTTLKRITELKARFFMRNDARVVVFSRFLLRQTAENAAVDTVDEALQKSQKEWQKNASSWWLMNSTNMD